MLLFDSMQTLSVDSFISSHGEESLKLLYVGDMKPSYATHSIKESCRGWVVLGERRSVKEFDNVALPRVEKCDVTSLGCVKKSDVDLLACALFNDGETEVPRTAGGSRDGKSDAAEEISG